MNNRVVCHDSNARFATRHSLAVAWVGARLEAGWSASERSERELKPDEMALRVKDSPFNPLISLFVYGTDCYMHPPELPFRASLRSSIHYRRIGRAGKQDQLQRNSTFVRTGKYNNY